MFDPRLRYCRGGRIDDAFRLRHRSHVDEPGSMILAGLGALGVAGAKLRRRKNAA